MAINKRLCTPSARDREIVEYTGKWTIGSSPTAGTPTKVAGGGMGMTLARTGAGLYTLTLEDTPASVVDVAATRVSNVGVISTLTYTTTGATFRTGLYASPQTVGDPANGEIISIKATVVRSLTK